MQTIESHHDDEPAIIAALRPELAELVSQDDWLPEDYANLDRDHYCQYLLYGDPLDRLSIVSIVWGPGQQTAIHDHKTWGLVGILRGAELSTNYDINPDGTLAPGATVRLDRGMVTAMSPSLGDIHRIANAHTDRASVSIHIYGGNIGRMERTNYDPLTGAATPIVSRYANLKVPNLWAP
jgi:predicted metal-dependent enzyme (double-stranded beta helix superfamily)